MKIFGREVTWAEPVPSEGQFELEVTDIGVAFARAETELLGETRSHSSIPAVFRSVQLLSDMVASLDLRQMIGRVMDAETPPILANPNPLETYHDFMVKVMLSLLWRGNAFLRVITRDRLGNPVSCQVLDPDEVSVNWDRHRLFAEYVWRDRPLELDKEIFHISLNKAPGDLLGMGPIEAARHMLIGVWAQQKMAGSLFEDNATPSGVLEVPQPLSKEEAEEALELWELKHSGSKRPAVTSGGVTFKPLTINPVDAQFIESRNFSVQEIARMFGLPGVFLLVSSGDSLTYNTEEGLMQQFLTLTLQPSYLEPIEQVFTRMLPKGRSARFDTTQLLKADLKSRYEAHEIGLRNGWLTINEVREWEGLAPIAGGDSVGALPVPQSEEVGAGA